MLALREYPERYQEGSKITGIMGGVGLVFMLAMLRNIWKLRKYQSGKVLPPKA